MDITEIQLEAEKLMLKHNAIFDSKVKLDNTIESASNALFYISILGGFIAVFSQFWIAMVSLSFAVTACGLLIYKSQINLINDMDVNLWLAERARIVFTSCIEMCAEPNVRPKNEFKDFPINVYLREIDSIKGDAEAHESDIYTASLLDFYDRRSQRNRYSAAIKNKYNRHGIKDLG